MRTASAAVLERSIAALGSQYVLGLRAKRCATGDIIADEQAQAARKEDVLSTLSQIATRFRTRVGESLATIEDHSTPLEEATTPSLEALTAYSAAWKAQTSAGWVRAQPFFERAIAIDPDFALGHAQVGRDFTGNLEREQRTLEAWAESYPRDARPHGLISGLALSSTGQYELAIAEADRAIALDPDLTPA